MSHVLDGAPEAAAWRARGEAAMLECLADQFASDGAYIQESHNYHRLAVHVLLWAQFVARSFGTSAPGELDGALLGSFTFLDGQRPTGGGELPNYGHNDGALLLALATGAHRDVRPTLQHLARSLGRPLPFAAGPWDEPAAWLGLGAGPRPPAPPPGDGLTLTSSGYVTSRRGPWMVASRIPAHGHHRPGQADALHVDVWHGARNLALDPGSYAYSEPPPWQNGLAETRVHNTCSAGDRSQMRRRGRFLWTHWSEATLLARDQDDGSSMWLASMRCAWGRDLLHTRLVRHDATGIDVLDLVAGAAPDVRRLHWNLEGTAWARTDDTARRTVHRRHRRAPGCRRPRDHAEPRRHAGLVLADVWLPDPVYGDRARVEPAGHLVSHLLLRRCAPRAAASRRGRDLVRRRDPRGVPRAGRHPVD
jgi:hypothetical protein